MSKIFINPGHALNVDCGAVNKELMIYEADIVRDIGYLVKQYLNEAGCSTMIMQSDNLAGEDGYSYRYSVCCNANSNNCDAFVSIHCNSATNKQAHGTEVFYYPHSINGRKLAQCIQDELVSTIHTYDRGIRENDDYIVLKNTNMPAVLVETAFISNLEEAKMLADVSKQDDIARAIARGITDYLKVVENE